MSTQDDEPLLVLRDVHVHYDTSHVLQGISASIRRGVVTMVLGRNGVGKTTMMRAVMGLVPHSGSIELDGASLDRTSTQEIVRRGVRYVPEDREVFAGLTVAENLRLAERSEHEPRYELVHDLFPDLKVRSRQLAGTLSGGQQQMLSLARALLVPASLIVVDEPTKGLAPKVVTEVVQALEAIKSGTTLLVVEQNVAAAARLADDVLIIDHGQIARRGGRELFDADRAELSAALGVSGTSRGDHQ